MSPPVVILGLGFTTQRLAGRLRERNIPVYAVTRRPERFVEFEKIGVRLCPLNAEAIPTASTVVHSIPPLAEPENSKIHGLINCISPRRILYISSTGVYGPQIEVNEKTPVAPNDDKGRARVAEEKWLSEPGMHRRWTTLILRSAAIYGPGRGVHIRLREGKLPRGSAGLVSRIHVDDLAAILEAAIGSELKGAWPVADDRPATSEEVGVWCAKLLNVELPQTSPRYFVGTGRSVDGRKIREALNIRLKYPSFKEGIPASLSEELQA